MISRRRVEDAIDTLIDLLDTLDGDADLEPEPAEELHDREADPAEDGIADKASLAFILAEKAKRQSNGTDDLIGPHWGPITLMCRAFIRPPWSTRTVTIW